MTNPPPVAPVEGHYALLRNGEVTLPIPDQWCSRAAFFDGLHHWWPDGKSIENCDAFDIIATISPEAMKLATNPNLIGDLIKEAFETSPEYKSLKGAIEKMLAENDRLRAANKKMKLALAYYADDGPPTPNQDGPWKQNSIDFGDYARCTLADVARTALQEETP